MIRASDLASVKSSLRTSEGELQRFISTEYDHERQMRANEGDDPARNSLASDTMFDGEDT